MSRKWVRSANIGKVNTCFVKKSPVAFDQWACAPLLVRVALWVPIARWMCSGRSEGECASAGTRASRREIHWEALAAVNQLIASSFHVGRGLVCRPSPRQANSVRRYTFAIVMRLSVPPHLMFPTLSLTCPFPVIALGPHCQSWREDGHETALSQPKPTCVHIVVVLLQWDDSLPQQIHHILPKWRCNVSRYHYWSSVLTFLANHLLLFFTSGVIQLLCCTLASYVYLGHLSAIVNKFKVLHSKHRTVFHFQLLFVNVFKFSIIGALR